MPDVIISETILRSIGDAIRSKNDDVTLYKPSEMPAAIESIESYPEPTGSVLITENGAVNVKDYATAVVNVSDGITLITSDAWDALSTAEKQAYGLVAIQSTSSGYERGLLVNGADYTPA